MAIPRALAERIRAGEDVSAEEVTEALDAERARIEKEEKEAEQAAAAAAAGRAGRETKTMKVPESVDESWLPAGATKVGGGNAARRRKK